MQNASLKPSKEERLQKRTFYGFKRENEYNYVKSTSLPIIKYKISPIGIGNVSSLRSKLQNIIGSIFEAENSNQINPCFQYILKKLIYFQSINSQKKTDYKNIVFGQMTSDLNNQNHQQAIRQKVYQNVAQWQEKQYQFKKQISRIQRLKIYHNKVAQFKAQLQTKMKAKYKQKRCKMTQNLKEKQLQQYIEEIIKNVDAIEILRISQQSIKYNTFQKKNKEYFEVSVSKQRLLGKQYYNFKINRPSNQIQPLLQNIYDMVRKREKNNNYIPESFVLYKDIFEQLKKYGINSEGSRNQYQCLSPATIVFDQISLAPKLSFQPLILNTLGVSKRPMCIQTRILFAPTPKQFDYFKSYPQYQQQTQLMLNDPFYGNIDIYDADRHRMTNEQVQQVQQERKRLEKIKQHITAWRFMLLSYYLLNSNQYGFVPNVPFNKQKQNHLKKQIKTAHEFLKLDMSQLSIFFGLQNQSLQSKQFNFSLAQIGEYLSIQNEDSIVQNNKYVLVKKYFQCRNLLIKQIIRLLVNDLLFSRIYNIKKYIILFLIIGIEIFQESSRYIKAQKSQARQRKRLRSCLQKELKRMRNDRNHYSYLQTTYDKVHLYRSRSPKEDYQAKFARQDELGKIMMTYVENVKQALKEMEKLNQMLDKIESKQSLTLQDKKDFAQIIEKIQNITDKYYQELKTVLNQFIFSELRLKHRDGPHKIPNANIPKFFKQASIIYTSRLQLLALTLISINQSNFIKYDSLVMPQFKIEDMEKKVQIYKNQASLKNEENLLKIISEVIQPAKLLPKKIEKLSGKAINLEFQNYQEMNRQSEYYQVQQKETQKIIVYRKQAKHQNSL